MKTIGVISDATGETAEKVVRAALLQFGDVSCDVRLYSRVRLENELEKIIERAPERRGAALPPPPRPPRPPSRAQGGRGGPTAPLAPGAAPPSELEQVDSRKV